MDELDKVDERQWETEPVLTIARTDLPTGRPHWTLREAVEAMQAADIDRLAIVDSDGRFVGVVSTSEILKLDEILGEAEP